MTIVLLVHPNTAPSSKAWWSGIFNTHNATNETAAKLNP
jgi:hypothetical protein